MLYSCNKIRIDCPLRRISCRNFLYFFSGAQLNICDITNTGINLILTIWIILKYLCCSIRISWIINNSILRLGNRWEKYNPALQKTNKQQFFQIHFLALDLESIPSSLMEKSTMKIPRGLSFRIFSSLIGFRSIEKIPVYIFSST